MHKCPKCGETELFQFTYDYSKAHRPVVDILCNNCGELFPPVLKLLKEEPKQENCCTPVGQIKRYVDCKGCDRKPKQEATLEEVAENEASIFYEKGTIEWNKYRQVFELGAKHQQERMYSEKEVKHIVSEALQSALVKVDLEQWFKQFKKKISYDKINNTKSNM